MNLTRTTITSKVQLSLLSGMVLISLLVGGCNSSPTISYDPEVLDAYWTLQDINIKDSTSQAVDFVQSIGSSMSQFMMICFPDGTGAQIHKTDYRPFSWDVASPPQEKTSEDTDIAHNQIQGKTSQDMRFYLMMHKKDTSLYVSDQGGAITMRFAKKHDPYKDFREDPMYYTHNQWRIKKNEALTPEEIKTRAINYLQHNLLLHKAALDDPARKFSNTNTLGLLVYYKGAIGLCDREKISDEWLGIFDDWEEAQVYYDEVLAILGDKMLRSKKKSSDWIEMNYSILQEILSE